MCHIASSSSGQAWPRMSCSGHAPTSAARLPKYRDTQGRHGSSSSFLIDSTFSTHPCVDIVGPLPKSEGQAYHFTVVDHFTRWPEAVPMADSTAASCTQALLHNWIARFGIPDTVMSDRGAQFMEQLWHQLAQRFGFQCNHTTAYHPHANGLVEQLHCHLKASLTTSTWTQELPWVLLGLCTAFKEDIGSSSAELVYGTTLSLPGELIVPSNSPDSPHSSFLHQLHNVANYFRPTPTSAHGKHGTYMPTGLQQARFVFVRCDTHKPPLQSPYDGPFSVVSRHTKHFLLDIRGRQDKVSIDRLKPAILDHRTEITVATCYAGYFFNSCGER